MNAQLQPNMNAQLQQGIGLTGLEQLRAFMREGRRPGIGHSLDFSLVDVTEGTATFEGVPGEHAYNPIGSVHGGYAATLLDSACGCAVHSKLNANQTYTTLELKVSYLKPMTKNTGKVRAHGRVINVGRRVAFAEAVITDAAGKIYATATSTLLVMEK
jgi:uncharacterized protein (TIGR00369 family)